MTDRRRGDISRRQFVTGLGALTGVRLLAPIVVRAGEGLGQALADPATGKRNRLIVIFLQGGNDGLNTVVPIGDVRGAPRYSVYRKVRPTIAYKPDEVRPLARSGDIDEHLGLNAKLRTLHRMYEQDRVAIVQGVDYPNHSYSHFTSTDIWQSGQPDIAPDSGWIGRHLDRAGIGEGELRGLGLGTELPLALRGKAKRGAELESIPATHFVDGVDQVAEARHDALERYGHHPLEEPLRHFAGKQAEITVGLVRTLQGMQGPPELTNYLAYTLLTARSLMERDFGVECVFINHGYGSYDTHAAQVQAQEKLLQELDEAIEAFYFGTIDGKSIGVGPVSKALGDRTILLTTSEFGRRIGEAGGAGVAGTDHGAAGPLFIVGPPAAARASSVRLRPGLHGDHPKMGTPRSPADNLEMTVDIRSVYQSVLEDWLHNPDPGYSKKFRPIQGLFV
jgi:uncharacterized protein (DUF1501 family)